MVDCRHLGLVEASPRRLLALDLGRETLSSSTKFFEKEGPSKTPKSQGKRPPTSTQVQSLLSFWFLLMIFVGIMKNEELVQELLSFSSSIEIVSSVVVSAAFSENDVFN